MKNKKCALCLSAASVFATTLITAAIIAISIIAITALALSPQGSASEQKVIYLSGTGSNSNTGLSAASPLAALDAAAAAAGDGGVIIVCGNVNLGSNYTFPAGVNNLTVTSVYNSVSYMSSAALSFSGNLYINADITFENIKISGASTPIISCKCNNITFGQGIETSGSIIILGGVNVLSGATAASASFSDDYTITVNSGNWSYIRGGNRRESGTSGIGVISGNASIIINGGSFTSTSETNGVSAGGMNSHTGSLSLVINGGSIAGSIYAAARLGTNSTSGIQQYSGSISITVNGGSLSGSVLGAVQDTSACSFIGSYTLCIREEAMILAKSITASGVSGKALIKTPEGFPASLISDFDSEEEENLSDPAGKAVFVKDGGAGNQSGSSAANASSSVATALGLLGSGGGVLVICGPATISSDIYEPARQNGIILTISSLYGGIDYSATAGAKLILGASWYMAGDTVFCHVNLVAYAGTRVIMAYGHKIVIGNGVICTLDGGANVYPYIYGGTFVTSGTIGDTSVIVNSGTWQHVISGNRSNTVTQNGTAYLEINGGTVCGYAAAAGRGTFNGNAVAVINGGLLCKGVYGIFSETSKKTYTGNISVTINAGAVFGNIRAALDDTKTNINGTYTLTVNGGNLSGVSDIAGGGGCGGSSSSSAVFANGTDPDLVSAGRTNFINPIRAGADPWMIYKDGYYYLVVVSGTSVRAYRAVDIAGLAYADYSVIWQSGAASGLESIWSPEMHYFSAEEMGANAGWYLYVACVPYGGGDNADRRIYCLKALTDDPMDGFGSPVTGAADMAERIIVDDANTNWNIGPSILRVNGIVYMTWTGRVGGAYESEHWQCIYIAKLTNPWTITGTPSMICRPTYDWEKVGSGYKSDGKRYPEVVEGATAVYGDDGSVFIVYSASGYWTNSYSLAQLRLKKDTNGNFLDPLSYNSWEKSSSPIFVQGNGAYGTGHASYITSPDGTERYFIYHGYLDSDHTSGRYSFVESYSVSYSSGVKLGNGTSAGVNSVMSVKRTASTLRDRLTGFTQVKKFQRGDVNCDGAVNNKDAACLMMYLSGWTAPYADVNRDGKMTNADAAALLRYLAGWDVLS